MCCMACGSPAGEAALMLFSTDEPVPADLLERMRGMDGVRAAHAVVLD